MGCEDGHIKAALFHAAVDQPAQESDDMFYQTSSHAAQKQECEEICRINNPISVAQK